MIIEPLPIFEASCNSNCPCCKAPIAGWVVENKFSCPSCNEKLKSNHGTSIKKGVISGIVFYLLFLGLINAFSWDSETKLIIYFSGAIIPYLVGISIFKILFNLRKNEKY